MPGEGHDLQRGGGLEADLIPDESGVLGVHPDIEAPDGGDRQVYVAGVPNHAAQEGEERVLAAQGTVRCNDSRKIPE